MAFHVVFNHAKCRNSRYQGSTVERFHVPDDKVAWTQDWKSYAPVEYTSLIVTNRPPWADPDISAAEFTWNDQDGKVNRKSYTQIYDVVDGRPRNPVGRTGVVGRGLLGKWGPNHAADPIVTRWKRGAGGFKMIDSVSRRPVLQVISIRRKDSGEWALPGGMVDEDEAISHTLKREFGEEALNVLQMSAQDKAQLEIELKEFFDRGHEVYRGYVDDSRNTDNAWIETVAVNFHDDDGTRVGRFPLIAGDDACDVAWHDVSPRVSIQSSHAQFLRQVAEMRDAHWD